MPTKGFKLITRNQTRDFQKRRVYGWAQDYVLSVDHSCLDIIACQRIVEDVLRCYGIKRTLPIKTFVAKKMRGIYKPDFTIKLTDKGKMRPIVLHEVAHALTRFYYGYSVPSHGKEFMGFFMILLNKWSRIPMSELKRTATLEQIEFVDPKYMMKPKSVMRPREQLRNEYEVKALPNFIPENVQFHLIPGKYGGYKGQFFKF